MKHNFLVRGIFIDTASNDVSYRVRCNRCGLSYISKYAIPDDRELYDTDCLDEDRIIYTLVGEV